MILLYFLLVTGAYGFSLHLQCKTDFDCIQPNTYCYQDRVCANCTNCSLYNRLPSAGCAKEKYQCGECLQGMEKEINLDGSFTCILSDIIPNNTGGPKEQNYDIIIYIAVGLIMLIVACTIIICFKDKLCAYFNKFFTNNSMNTSDDTKPAVEVPPPPYTVNPTAPLEEASTPPIYHKIYHHVENEPSQTANAYSNPQYVRGGDLENNEEQEEQETSEADALINTTSITQPDDEETQPSNWTPTASRSETGSIAGPTSFEAAFSNLQQLTISQPNINNQQITTYRSNSHPNFEFNSEASNSENSSDPNNPHVHNQIGPVNISINLNMSK